MGSMGKGGLYVRWLKKYGEDIANKKMNEYREKQKLANSGKNNPFYGKHHTEKTKQKIREQNIGKRAWNKGIKNPNICGEKNPAKREDVKKKISNGVKNSYTEELRKSRSIHFKNIDREKIRKTNEKNGSWRKLCDMPKFERYRNKVRQLTQESYTKYLYLIDPKMLRSRKYHLDHIYSIAEGFDNNIEPKIISHPTNLRIIKHSLNERKSSKSDITLNELMEKINEFND